MVLYTVCPPVRGNVAEKTPKTSKGFISVFLLFTIFINWVIYILGRNSHSCSICIFLQNPLAKWQIYFFILKFPFESWSALQTVQGDGLYYAQYITNYLKYIYF